MEIEKLIPATKSYIWGGKRLINLNKETKEDTIAESWEVSFSSEGPSKLANGKLLKDEVTCMDLGSKCSALPSFPILNKLIDANKDLSIQVHPNDEYALANENTNGKSELWYVVDAKPNSFIYLGFNKDVTEIEILERIKNNSILEVINKIPVKPGDCYFVPARTIHAIGSGCFIYEVQENSNITYRVYDYDRKDKNGNKRELHIEKALKVLNKMKTVPQNLQGTNLINCSYFSVNKILSPKEVSAPIDSFLVFTIIKGQGKVNNIDAFTGDTFFVPANKKADFCGDFDIITTNL